MPHAVLVVNSTRRPLLDSEKHCLVSSRYANLTRNLIGSQVILYQSGQAASGKHVTIGYFGVAVIVSVNTFADDARLISIGLTQLTYWKQPRPLTVDFNILEPDLIDGLGRFKGWLAARDIRIISADTFDRISAGMSVRAHHPLDADEADLDLPQFRGRDEQVRDGQFAALIYRAYSGKCAISGVTLLSRDGTACALEAAHLYPLRLEVRNTVNSGVLLAPSWHARYDCGLIALHEDYSWSAIVEDADTDAIKERSLKLPLSAGDWPDAELIRRNRQRMQLEPILYPA